MVAYENFFRAVSSSTQAADGGGGVAFGEAASAFIEHERTMVVRGRRPGEGAVEQELARGAGDQIRAAHDFGDFHQRIIDRAGELVAGQVVFSPNEKVSEIDARDRALRTGGAIDEFDHLAIRNAKSPVAGG